MKKHHASTLHRRATGAAAAAIVVLGMLGAQPAQAEDIDLYSGTGGAVASPNVLFFLDNGGKLGLGNRDFNYVLNRRQAP